MDEDQNEHTDEITSTMSSLGSSFSTAAVGMAVNRWVLYTQIELQTAKAKLYVYGHSAGFSDRQIRIIERLVERGHQHAETPTYYIRARLDRAINLIGSGFTYHEVVGVLWSTRAQERRQTLDDEVVRALAAVRDAGISMEEFGERMRVLAIPEAWEAILAVMRDAAEAGRRLREQYPEAFDVELAKRRERERSRRDVEEKRRWLRRNRKTPK